MFKNRFVLLVAVLAMLIVTLGFAPRFLRPQESLNLSWPPRPVIIPVTGAEGQPYIMDSATRSYIAWGEALKAAGKLGDSVACANTTQENVFAGIPNNVDSATRSYIAWGLALQAKDNIRVCR